MQYLYEYSIFVDNEVNEGFRHWLATFLTLVSLGFAPMNLVRASEQEKQDFVNSFNTEEQEAINFVGFLNKTSFKNSDPTKLEDIFDGAFKGKGNFDDIKELLIKTKDGYTIDRNKLKGGTVEKVQSNYDIEKIQPLKTNGYTNFISDYAGAIPDTAEVAINKLIYDYEKKTGVEIAVLVINSTNGNPISNYAQETGQRWGVGKKNLNNGLMFVIAIEDRKCFIATGYGMEGMMPDATCTHICTNYFTPNAKNGDYRQGIRDVFNAIVEKTGTESIEVRKQQIEKERIERNEAFKRGLITFGEILLILGLIAGLSYVIYKGYRKKKEMRESIQYILDKVKSIKESGTSNAHPSLTPIVDRMDVVLSNVLNDKVKINEKFYNYIQTQYQELQDLISGYNSIIKKVNAVENTEKVDIIKNLTNSIRKANSIAQEIRNKGYRAEDINENDLDNIERLFDEIQRVYQTDLDAAFNMLKTIRSTEGRYEETVSKYSSILNSIKESEKLVANASHFIGSALKKLSDYVDDYHEHYSTNIKNNAPEIEKSVNNAYEEWKNEKHNDVMKAAAALIAIVELVDNFISKYDRLIKKKEEEEEDRSSSSSSSTSYGSSSRSGGGFGGFSGGSFGGGGGGSSWILKNPNDFIVHRANRFD